MIAAPVGSTARPAVCWIEVSPYRLLHHVRRHVPGQELSSSHVSLPATMPSPQIVSHVVGAPVHDHPFSIWQLALQPSPFDLLPSSHASPAMMTASPHGFGGTKTAPSASL